MSDDDEAQERMNRHHEEVARKKREALYAQYMARVKVYADARAQGKFPVEMQPLAS